MTFVFLGTVSEVWGHGIKLTRFGERVELPEDVAAETKIHGGLPCITAEDFDAIGFTADELKRYSVSATHDAAPLSFREKKAEALEILHTQRGGE